MSEDLIPSATTVIPMRPFKHSDGVVLFVTAGKGGVGKSTLSQALAEQAATVYNRVVLIDMSPGQGDQHSYLRFDRSKRPLPTLLDARRGGKLGAAILNDRVVREWRSPGLPDTHFGVVLAPPDALADPEVITPAVYAQVIREAAAIADIVIVDCPVAKGYGDSTMDRHGHDSVINEVVIPMMRLGAWGLMVGDPSAPSGEKTAGRLSAWRQDGTPVNRFGFVLNMAPAGFAQGDAIQRMLDGSGGASFLGAIPESESIKAAFNSGAIPNSDPAIEPVLDSVLHFCTSAPQFDPQMKQYVGVVEERTEVGISEVPKAGLFSRLFGRK